MSYCVRMSNCFNETQFSHQVSAILSSYGCRMSTADFSSYEFYEEKLKQLFKEGTLHSKLTLKPAFCRECN